MAVPHDPHPSFSSCGVPVVCRRSSLAYAPASPRAPLPESFTLSVPCAQARAVMRAESAALSTYYSAVRPFRERGAPHPRRTMWEAKLPPVMPSRTPPCSPAPPCLGSNPSYAGSNPSHRRPLVGANPSRRPACCGAFGLAGPCTVWAKLGPEPSSACAPCPLHESAVRHGFVRLGARVRMSCSRGWVVRAFRVAHAAAHHTSLLMLGISRAGTYCNISVVL